MRASRQAREMEILSLMLIKTDTETAVEVNVSISFSFVEIRIFDLDFDRATHFLPPSRVGSIGKRSILCLTTTTNR